MIAFSRTVPDSWSAHDRLANTSKGWGIHALNLDLDVGPLLQTQKLLNSVVFARKQGYDATLTAAELEMMNLTGDGNGIDMIKMPAGMARACAHREFLPAGRLCAQSHREPHQRRFKAARHDQCQDG